jgi:acetyl esterase/lipase
MNQTAEHEKETNFPGTGRPVYAFDQEVEASLTALLALRPPSNRPERGDWKRLRELGNANMDYWASLLPAYPEVQTKTFYKSVNDGAQIELRWYSKNGNSPGSAIVYAHGGGMVLGDLDKYNGIVSEYVNETGVPFLSVAYRLAPQAQGPSLANDIFSGLEWLVEHAEELGVNPERIAVMGDSAGGGIAAGAAIMARDHQVNVARQILIYPMLDDRNLQPDKHLLPFLTWTYDDNFTGWSALLGDQLGTKNVAPEACPSRLTNFAGLAPAYIEVGEQDIFRDEDISYGQELARAGIPTELHALPGAPHGFDRFAPASQLTLRAMADRLRVIKSI